MSHDIDTRSESLGQISIELASREKSVQDANVEKLLGFAPSSKIAGVDSMEYVMSSNSQPFIEDGITELMEEDVWGLDDDMSSFDESTTPSSKQWPDSESDSHFSALHDEGQVSSRSRFAGFLSPSQFSPIAINDREAMRGQQIHSLHIMTTQYGVPGTINDVQYIMGTSWHHDRFLSNGGYSPGDMPRSAPVEVPSWSRLCAQVDDSDEDEQDFDNAGRVPPHLYVAKQLARSQIITFSVIEGAGRTLKGRDASEVRDAVWKQTGYSG